MPGALKRPSRLCRARPRLDCFSKTVANQPFFKYIKRKITPAQIQKIMQKKDWFAPPALLAGEAASLIFFENGSRIVQYLLPSRKLRPFGQNAPARTKGEAGVFVGQEAVRRCKATHKNKFLFSDFSGVASDTKQPVFNPTLYAWSINK